MKTAPAAAVSGVHHLKMNIFALSKCPRKAAQYLIDKHVVKMILESVQMLCTAFVLVAPPEALAELEKKVKLYKPCHKNHPCTIWARERKVNFVWLCCLASQIGKEYTFRYKKTHKSEKLIKPLLDAILKLNANETNFVIDNTLSKLKLTDFALAMPDEIRKGKTRAPIKEAIELYKKYYFKKLENSWAVYKRGREPPIWTNKSPIWTNNGNKQSVEKKLKRN